MFSVHLLHTHQVTIKYTDDSQLYTSLFPENLSPVKSMVECIKDINNRDASQIVFIGASAAGNMFSFILSVSRKYHTGHIGLTGVCDLDFQNFVISSVTNTAFHYVKQILSSRFLLIISPDVCFGFRIWVVTYKTIVPCGTSFRS